MNLEDNLVIDELYCPEVRAVDASDFDGDENLLDGLSPPKHNKSVLKASSKTKLISPLDSKSHGRFLHPNKITVQK